MRKSRRIRFRLDTDKVDALDAIARSSNRDMSSLLNEAIANYLELQAYHARLIKEGLTAVEEGRTISLGVVRSKIASYARRHRISPKK